LKFITVIEEEIVKLFQKLISCIENILRELFQKKINKKLARLSSSDMLYEHFLETML